MKPNTTLAALACASALLLSAASAQAAETAPAKTHAKPAAARAAAAKKPARPKARIAKTAAKAVEEVTPVDDDPNITLSEADLEVAKRVYVGAIKCELGANVQIDADEKHPGFFTVRTAQVRYRMHPVESRTGAVRLEDPRAGAIWIQLGNKSMLMNQKIGERLADECQGTQQVAFAEEMKKNPPKSLFEPADAPAK
ncbi:hypothetical protein [Xylophilus sp.]|uniref:hypothetical protein n=1 Tax=Xylophilus sp. TaxID=2653893 RepID=UPI0013B97B3A|nr:hypothetical protein [Xylophilus sp.]KAF1046841.1 MAG: hypothetical protein GAK38_02240 [Xylophilus sp.]